jgi:hypothetical protein
MELYLLFFLDTLSKRTEIKPFAYLHVSCTVRCYFDCLTIHFPLPVHVSFLPVHFIEFVVIMFELFIVICIEPDRLW